MNKISQTRLARTGAIHLMFTLFLSHFAVSLLFAAFRDIIRILLLPLLLTPVRSFEIFVALFVADKMCTTEPHLHVDYLTFERDSQTGRQKIRKSVSRMS